MVTRTGSIIELHLVLMRLASLIMVTVTCLTTLFYKVDQLGITPGTWYHYCMCWSVSSNTADVYHNGIKVGSFTTQSGKMLRTGGILVLGQIQTFVTKFYIDSNRYTFGGELYKLNMFPKKFSAEEVRAMFQAGICSDIEKRHGSYRQLTWESIIEQSRSGNVQLVPVCCSAVE